MNNVRIVFFEENSFSTVIPAATQPVLFINDDFAGSLPLASFQMSSLLLLWISNVVFLRVGGAESRAAGPGGHAGDQPTRLSASGKALYQYQRVVNG
jgi:hypothetical protein